MKRKEIYKLNKDKKKGDKCICPICKCEFTKTHYAQAFCCNECKVKYHNDKQRGKRNEYFRKYDMKHPERKLRRALYSMDVHNVRDADELDARMALVTDEDFRRYVNDDCDVCDIPNCNVDLATMYNNYLCRDYDI